MATVVKPFRLSVRPGTWFQAKWHVRIPWLKIVTDSLAEDPGPFTRAVDTFRRHFYGIASRSVIRKASRSPVPGDDE